MAFISCGSRLTKVLAGAAMGEKITEDAKRLLNVSNIPIEDIAWNLIRQKLETHYTVRHTFYYYVQELSTMRQKDRKPRNVC